MGIYKAVWRQLVATDADTAAPTLATDGLPVPAGYGALPSIVRARIETAALGSADLIIWGYVARVFVGATDAEVAGAAGWSALDEFALAAVAAADLSERFDGFRAYERIYVQVVNMVVLNQISVDIGWIEEG